MTGEGTKRTTEHTEETHRKREAGGVFQAFYPESQDSGFGKLLTNSNLGLSKQLLQILRAK